MTADAFRPVAEIPVDAARALVYAEGWQSWTPTGVRPAAEPPPPPAHENLLRMCYRSDVPRPAGTFQGEGLLAVDPGDGSPVHVVAAADVAVAVPAVRAELRGSRLLVTAAGAVDHRTDPGAGGLEAALARHGERLRAAAGGPPLRVAPTVWCSWYHYFTKVSEDDLLENLAAMDELDVPVDVVQLDDGWQAEIGDWLALSDRFRSLPDLAARIRDRGRRAGIWVAPFLVGDRSRVHAEHPDWLVDGADAGRHWGQRLGVLDVTHPEAAGYLTEVFAGLRAAGFDYFKIDFVNAGALPGRRHDPGATGVAAYREGLRVIRAAIGDAYLVGCGAPLLPSVGLVDAMRVSPDTDPRYEPRTGDLSQPAQRSAALTGRARAWQHGRLWVNDPDCLIVRPAVERREEWAAHVERWGGLRASSDRLRDLDAWGLETTRRLLRPVSTTPLVAG